MRRLGSKEHDGSVAKVPVILAVGMREAEEGTVSMRRLGSKEQSVTALDEAVAALKNARRSDAGRYESEWIFYRPAPMSP